MPPLRAEFRPSANTVCRSRANLTTIITKRQLNTNTPCGVCLKFCAFCETWKLILLLCSKTQSKGTGQQTTASLKHSIKHLRSASDPTPFRTATTTDEYPNEKLLDILYSPRRSRLASMLTLNTLEEVSSDFGWEADDYSCHIERASTR